MFNEESPKEVHLQRSVGLKLMVGIVTVFFSIIGALVLQFSRAATSADVSVQAESGSLMGSVSVLHGDADMSGEGLVFNDSGVGPTATPSPTGTVHDHIPADQLPVGNPGSPDALLTSGAPFGDPTPTQTSAFRIECGFSHMSYDDPIVYPGQQGKAHLHTFFGNTGIDYNSTYQSISTTGNSTCSGGILNRSGYWVPTMMHNGAPIAPAKIVVYYKSGWPSTPYTTIKKLPDGLKMIAGNQKATSSQNPPGKRFIDWYCASTNNGQDTIPHCAAGDELILSIDFPNCWDGVHLDSADHQSHMSYPDSYSGSGCPSTHPIAIPRIGELIHWPVSAGGSVNWRLASDMYAADIPGGYSAHADYMEGWDKTTKDTFVSECLVAGKDCQVRWLGNGQSLLNVPGVN